MRNRTHAADGPRMRTSSTTRGNTGPPCVTETKSARFNVIELRSLGSNTTVASHRTLPRDPDHPPPLSLKQPMASPFSPEQLDWLCRNMSAVFTKNSSVFYNYTVINRETGTRTQRQTGRVPPEPHPKPSIWTQIPYDVGPPS